MDIIPEFSTQEEAFEWLYALIDNQYCDNARFAYLDDQEALTVYAEQEAHGCCGSADETVKIDGRLAKIGFNYGH